MTDDTIFNELREVLLENKYKQKDIAEMMEQSRSQITNLIRLISMPEWLLRDLSNDKLSFGHARALLTLSEKELEEIVPNIYLNNIRNQILLNLTEIN